jgi:hypothetical protein
MKIRFLIFLFLLLAILPGPVSAINATISAEHISEYSIVPPEGYIIYEIIINDLPLGINQTHILNYNGAVFLLDIRTASSYVIFREAWVNLTLPDGSVQSAYASAWDIAPSYKTSIQPVWTQPQSITVPFLTVNLMIGLTPAIVAFSSGPVGKGPLGWNVSSSIPFTAASGTFGAVTNVYCEIMTPDEFQKNVVNYNPLAGLKNLGAAVFQWTWDMVVGFLSQIPVIGPMFISGMQIVGIVGGVILFWLIWFIENASSMIAALEVTICLLAFIFAGKKPTPEKVASNIWNYNIAVGFGFLFLITTLITWLGIIIQVIAAVVEAIKRVI